MNTLADVLGLVVTMLQAWPLSHAVRVLETHQFSDRQFALKVRAELTAGGTLQVRLYRNGEHTDYAYQLIRGGESIRWDNKEHFPSIASHPHHFHSASGQVEASPLIGDPSYDLPFVLDYLTVLCGRNTKE
jgi:hypothetical protein